MITLIEDIRNHGFSVFIDLRDKRIAVVQFSPWIDFWLSVVDDPVFISNAKMTKNGDQYGGSHFFHPSLHRNHNRAAVV